MMFSFSVRLHENTVLSDAPCVYGIVDLNIGDGYDEFSGKTNFFQPEKFKRKPYVSGYHVDTTH